MAAEIQSERREHVGIVRIHRPDAMNALNTAALRQLIEACEHFDGEAEVRCLLLVGDDRAFASGRELGEISDASAIEMMQRAEAGLWERLRRVRKPIVAAVSGFASGVGCELMLCCDIVVASEAARISQSEVNIGIMPGAGATQRLTRIVGKAKAMDLILTGRTLTAPEAFSMGLVSRVAPREHYFAEALRICHELAQRPPIALRAAKAAILAAEETTLSQGLEFERQLHCLLFASEDQREGMRAFLEKRAPVFVGR